MELGSTLGATKVELNVPLCGIFYSPNNSDYMGRTHSLVPKRRHCSILQWRWRQSVGQTIEVITPNLTRCVEFVSSTLVRIRNATGLKKQ
jgi:hypothetical protein